MELDAVDLRIRRELQADASLSNVALAERVHCAVAPARVKAMKASGLIRSTVALRDAKLGLHLNVFISISLKQQTRAALEAFEAFEASIAARDEVTECHLMTGNADCLVRVAVADIGALERFILEQPSPMARSRRSGRASR